MKKSFSIRKSLSTIIIALFFAAICPCFTILARAGSDPYEKGFSIHDAVQYAMTYAEQDISSNKIPNSQGGNCTYFVSKCLASGGLQMDDNWNDNDTKHLLGGYSDAFNTFVNVDRLRNYLFKKSYPVRSFKYKIGEPISKLPSIGDVIQIDQNLDGKGDHSAFCIGYQKKDKNYPELLIAQNSPNEIVSFTKFLSRYKGTIKIYYIHMTDTYGLKDVTNKYIEKYKNKYIAIKSHTVKQYVSANTNQNVTTVNTLANKSKASTLEYFQVKEGDYGAVGFKSIGNGNYLSARIDLDYSFAPIRASYGQTYTKPKTWESFRIYEKQGIQYIQSQANGKWLQVVADNAAHPLKASAKKADDWEKFQMEGVNYSPNNTATSEKPSANPSDGFSNNPSNSTIVSQYFKKSDYNEGWYEGEWKNNQPNGNGKLTYDGFSDGKYYSIGTGNHECKALYYEGQFLDGYRYGKGTVVYENGYKDEGTFYGLWQNGKVVFEGKRWLMNNTYNGYWPITIIASSPTKADEKYGKWQSVK